VYPIGQFTLSGSWGQMQSSGSGLSGSYTGNRAVSTGSQTATATVTVSRETAYDLWVHYTARTSGGYVKVEIDGSQALVNEIGDPASLGFKAFSSYGAVDLQRRQTMKVASGLTGPHAVTLSFGGVATPGGNAIMVEAVSTSADLSDTQIVPPYWQPNTAYQMGDEVQMGGLYYAARANGTSGTLGPLHSNGIASDGALDWRADFRPTYPEFVAIDYASEREYALRFTVAGAATEVGGQTHGNDLLSQRDILLDGETWVPVATGTGLSVGSHVTVHEETVWQTQAGALVANCRIDRTISAGAITHNVAAIWTGADAQLEWFYAGMLPMVHWDGESQSTVVDTVSHPDGSPVSLATYAGVNPPNVVFPGVSSLGLTGAVLDETLSYGCRAAATIVPGNRVDQFAAFLRPNLDARTASGGLDWGGKAYVTAALSGNQTCVAGDLLAFSNLHRIKMG
ncbi:hypothetical protein, partial [Yoonia sp.]|uniref:hypothetical protein n=1 Tax=Yoonia sp. TaxID=2212373 RepID=UPI0035C82BFB